MEQHLIDLINAVKHYPRLYIKTSKKDDVSKDWSAVAQECKITTSQAKRHWDTLLTKYVNYLKGIQDFHLAPYMGFLQPYFFQTKDTKYIDEVELLNAIDSNNATYMEHSKIPAENMDIEKDIKTEDSEGPLTIFNENTETIAVQKDNIVQQTSSFTNLSSLELIFLGYAKQLQKMPLALQLKTKRKIADIMDEAELQMIPNTLSTNQL